MTVFTVPYEYATLILCRDGCMVYTSGLWVLHYRIQSLAFRIVDSAELGVMPASVS